MGDCYKGILYRVSVIHSVFHGVSVIQGILYRVSVIQSVFHGVSVTQGLLYRVSVLQGECFAGYIIQCKCAL